MKLASKNNVKGIFIEKPFAVSLKEAKRIIEICKKNKIILLVDHQRRFHPIYETVKKILKKRNYNFKIVSGSHATRTLDSLDFIFNN